MVEVMAAVATSLLPSSPSTLTLSDAPERALRPSPAPATPPGANLQASTSCPLLRPSPCLSEPNHFHETAFPSGPRFLELSVELTPPGRVGCLPKGRDNAGYSPRWCLGRWESEGPGVLVSTPGGCLLVCYYLPHNSGLRSEQSRLWGTQLP